jgi:spore maturation protein CgeB
MKTLADFRNIHQGATIVVCGCGESLNELTEPARFITIGVNDVGRRFDPDYLVVVNPRNQFSGDRFSYVERSKASHLFTQLDLGLSRENVVRFDLGVHAGTDLSDPNVLHYTQNSPYVALCLAVHMGAQRIGLIGVDFTDHHFFAPTGRHALQSQLALIDQQYKSLYDAIRERGVEVFNFSSNSRLTALPKMSLPDFSASLSAPASQDVTSKRIFFINYKFLSCGEVFTVGLRNAARSIGLSFQDAYWDDPNLPAKIQQFRPDWLFVVHGRRFVERWRGRFPGVKKAVWLLDEPYEVDDTSRWSNEFDAVYLNDPNTLDRHRNARYLPVAFDPDVHHENGHTRNYQVGFIGGHNNARERYLLALHEAGLLSYIVGGPWRSSALRSLCLSPNIPANETAELYKQTRIVVNLFREVHHYNERGVPAFSMNPRIYEALACGAVVVSETRDEISTVFPEVPLFSTDVELVQTVGKLVQSEDAYASVKKACQEKLTAHSYRERLLHVLETLDPATAPVAPKRRQEATMTNVQTSSLPVSGWTACGDVIESSSENEIILYKANDDGPGSERGLASESAYGNVELEFDLYLAADACFIAKLRQAGQLDQLTNSYHLFCHPRHMYFARHHRVLQNIQLKREQWQHVKLSCYGAEIRVEVDGLLVARVVDNVLREGYCFVGVKSGRVWLRNLNVRELAKDDPVVQPEHDAAVRNGLPDYTVLHTTAVNDPPLVSIITTVYDRVSLLAECLRTVRELQFRNFEHVIVSDHPPAPVVDNILTLVRTAATDGSTYANLTERANNWGIAPASVGLHLARGRYVCFLSDDNGYTPDHFEPLVQVLNENEDIAFAYSSCQYGGRFVLRNSTPLPGGIDLGQPLFRKEIFDRYLPGKLPFDMMAWDWHMIETFMRHGLKWRHVDRASFLFRLAACNGRA